MNDLVIFKHYHRWHQLQLWKQLYVLGCFETGVEMDRWNASAMIHAVVTTCRKAGGQGCRKAGGQTMHSLLQCCYYDNSTSTVNIAAGN